MLGGNEIRKLYLDYFKNKRQHTVVESSSLVALEIQYCIK